MGRQWQVTAEGSRTAAPPEAAAPALVAEASVPGVGAELPGELELIELGRRSEASGLGSGTVDALWVAVDRLCRLYPTVLAPALRHQARQYLRYAVGLLGGRTTLAEHRDLLVQAGWLAALLACVSYDAGDAAEAEIARRMTAKLGEQAGHGELVAWSFEIAAWFALVEGRFPETVALAEAGAARAGATNAGVQLTLQAARGYARMHDSRAHGALEAGRALLDRLPEPGHPEHHFVFDRDKYEFYVATIYTWLGTDDAAATENAVEVVTRCRNPDGSTRWPTRLSTTRVNLGLIAGRRGDLDEAVSLGIDALGCARRSAELIPRALELQGQLATQYPRERLVTEYQERLAEEISGDKTRAT